MMILFPSGVSPGQCFTGLSDDGQSSCLVTAWPNSFVALGRLQRKWILPNTSDGTEIYDKNWLSFNNVWSSVDDVVRIMLNLLLEL